MRMRAAMMGLLLSIGLASLVVVEAAGAALPVPEPVAVTAAQRFVTDVDPEELPWVLQLTLPAVPGAGAYLISNPDAGWSFRCESDWSVPASDTASVPVVNGVPLEIEWWEGGGGWLLPLGSVRTADGSTTVLFPQGESRLEVRALPQIGSPVGDASPPASIAFRWYEQATRSSIRVAATPWGLNVTRGATSAGSIFSGPRPGGRLEASRDGRRWYPVEQYSQSPSARTWSAAEGPAINADPTVWPRFGMVLPDGLTYGRFRVGTTALRPLSDSLWYRQSLSSEIQEISAGTFVRFGSSTAAYHYRPKPSPALSAVTMTPVRAGRAHTWRGTISSRAAAKAPVKWRLYQKVSTATSQTPPARAWVLRKAGTASYAAESGTTRAYAIRFVAVRRGTWRLDVTYGGSSGSRPDGYSKTFIAR